MQIVDILLTTFKNAFSLKKILYFDYNFVLDYNYKKFVPDGSVDKNLLLRQPSGGRLNKKDGLTRYGNSHVKDKTS